MKNKERTTEEAESAIPAHHFQDEAGGVDRTQPQRGKGLVIAPWTNARLFAVNHIQPKRGKSLVVAPWTNARLFAANHMQPKREKGLPWSEEHPETPRPDAIVEGQTMKQPVYNAPKALVQVPAAYMGGQVHSGPAGPQAFAPPLSNTAMPGSGASFNPYIQDNPAPTFAPPLPNTVMPGSGVNFNAPAQVNPGLQMFAPPMPRPGSFNPNRIASGQLGVDPMRSDRANSRDLPPERRKRRRKHRRVPVWARIVIGLLTVMIIALGGGYWYYQTNFAGAVGNIVNQKVQLAPGEEDPNAGRTGDILSGPRINILLLGSDTDEKFDGSYIAQTDIVLTIDPASKTVGMLSIPRDFYINVPGYGMHKLDEAYGLGGVDLSRRTIEDDFGISINYYAWIGLDGFTKVINEVGGVDVDVLHPIVDDNYPDDVGANANNPYAVKRLYLAPGPQHLAGDTALEYVRSRHADLKGDFGRSVRQQQVLAALKSKLANPAIFNKLSAIANDMNGYLKTDMQLPDILKLMNFARSLNLNNISKLVLEPPYSSGGKAPAGSPDAGADIVIPNCAEIVPAIQKMLDLGANAACNIQSDSGESVNTPLAYKPTQNSDKTTGASASSSAGADLSALASSATTSLSSGPNELYGVSSLLDLFLMGVFESTNVLQI